MGCFPACFACSASKRRKSILSKDHQEKREETLLIKLIKESNSKEEVEMEVKSGTKKRVTFNLSVKESSRDANQTGKEEEEEDTSKTNELLSDTNSSAPNNRYQNCRESTDGSQDIGLEEGDEKDEHILLEESSDSLFSLSIDGSRKQTCEVENGEKEVNSPMPAKTIARRFGDSVLSPIENIARWNEREDQVIVKEIPVSQCLVKNVDKENILVTTKLAAQEIGVDASLSSWLVGSAKASESNNGDQSVGLSEVFEKENLWPKNEVILGESSRPRSRSQSPVVGTVGSFWAHTGSSI